MVDISADLAIDSVIANLQDRYLQGGSVSVIVGISGGVDSAVSAYLLKKAGFDVQGVFLRCFPDVPGCRVAQDYQDALAVASMLEIRLETFDFVDEYAAYVLSDFYKEYASGRTPNPDVLCNQRVKFGVFFERVMESSTADYFATGHYVKNILNNRPGLYQPKDLTKDQTYFLHRVDQAALDATIFPLSDLTKEEVRTIAGSIALPVSQKPDSTGICFVGNVDLQTFLSEHVQLEPGEVVTQDGAVIGTHAGVYAYTLGQRRGFATTVNEPMYVLEKRLETNQLVVGSYEETFVESFTVEDVQWRCPSELVYSNVLLVRIRNLGELYPVSVEYIDEGAEVCIEKGKTIQSPAPGQYAVFYSVEGEVLGSGVIR